jgi:hypothetical protein
LGGQIVEEGLERSQTLIARAHIIMALSLQAAQKTPNPLHGEILNPYSREPAAEILGDEEQEQSQGVPIALHRGVAHAFLGLQVIFKKGVQQGAEGSCAHEATPCTRGAAKRSNRLLACSSRSAVMVR